MNRSFGTPEQFKAAIENRIAELEANVPLLSTTDSCAADIVEGSENLSVRDAKNPELETEAPDYGCVTC